MAGRKLAKHGHARSTYSVLRLGWGARAPSAQNRNRSKAAHEIFTCSGSTQLAHHVQCPSAMRSDMQLSWPMAGVFLETTGSDKCQWMELGCGRAVVRRHSCQPPCWSVPLGMPLGQWLGPDGVATMFLSSYTRQPPGHISALKLVGSMDGKRQRLHLSAV